MKTCSAAKINPATSTAMPHQHLTLGTDIQQTGAKPQSMPSPRKNKQHRRHRCFEHRISRPGRALKLRNTGYTDRSPIAPCSQQRRRPQKQIVKLGAPHGLGHHQTRHLCLLHEAALAMANLIADLSTGMFASGAGGR
ncbi:MAG: hypothetical protein ACJA1F_000138 [Paracoccaceae bacterium]|jgi:hypothetical protein